MCYFVVIFLLSLGGWAYLLTLKGLYTLSFLSMGSKGSQNKNCNICLNCCNRFKNCHFKRVVRYWTTKLELCDSLVSFIFASSPRSWQLYLFIIAISLETWSKFIPYRGFPWINKSYYKCSFSLHFLVIMLRY